MSYIPYTGNFSQYGFGPEHRFFSEIAAPIGGTGGQSSTPPNPYAENNNPYIDAFEKGRHGGAEGGAGTSEQSNDPGKNDWGGAKQAAANLAGFALGPFSAALGVGANMARGINSAGTGILGALGINPFGAATQSGPYQHAMQTIDLTGQPIGQTTGSPSMDFFGAINDLSTVGQLGAVLDARDINREAPELYSGGFGASGQPSVPGQGDGPNPFDGGTQADTPGGYGGNADSSPDPNGGHAWAKGGYFQGATGGQEDKVPALLSDGEYVIDAPTVAALGGGNNEAGARALDRFRAAIRKISHGTTKQPRPVDIGEAFRAASRAS